MTTPNHHQDHVEGGEETPAPETAEARRSWYIGVGIALGMTFGAGLGLVFGQLYIENFVLGMPIGIVLGVAIGVGIGLLRAAATERQQGHEADPGENAS